MSMSPLITVIIPVANGAEYLFESLSSVINQSYTCWECIVAMNGVGCQGPAEAVCAAFAHPQVRPILLPSTINTKVAALNAAVTLANGSWIALLDVDDRWHTTKLAEQVAALQGPAAGAIVVGTQAQYFGEFRGVPTIPTGWVDPAALQHENPIINSAALIRRDWARWAYHPACPGLMEDYYLWIKIALQHSPQSVLYNVPAILVDHRIHATSAFNALQISPKPLQRLAQNALQERNQNGLSRHTPAPIVILTTACNAPHFIRIQKTALERYMPPQQPWRFVVFNDAKAWPDITNFGDPTMRQQIEDTCRELGIESVPVENRHHQHITRSASHRHCDTLRCVMAWLAQQQQATRFWMLDSDMWPVAPVDLGRYYGRGVTGTFVRQERQGIVYAWPNLWWLDTTWPEDVEGLCWDLATHCDTGGASAPWVAQRGTQVKWLAPHKSSGAWNSQHIPPSLAGVSTGADVKAFLDADPRNGTDGTYWAELYDDTFFHVRAGSNWCGEGAEIHRRIAELAIKCFS